MLGMADGRVHGWGGERERRDGEGRGEGDADIREGHVSKYKYAKGEQEME